MSSPLQPAGSEVPGPYGVIAMAAYQPDPGLFRVQLESIQKQSHKDFLCLISVDGDPDPVHDLVASATGRDPRFVVLGYGNRLGFYGNFERVLSNVPPDAQWVALSDQDDYWYPEKLSVLLPHLEAHQLVSGQARVVEAGTGRVITANTARRNVPYAHLIAQNQITGGQTVFRRSLLDLALPFPRLNTVTEVHDHWLAACAGAVDSVLVVDEIVQDYVQHGANVLGEAAGGFDPLRSVRQAASLADRFEGGHSPAQVAAACRKLSFGWRQVMMDTLSERLDRPGPEFARAYDAFSSGHRWPPALSVLASGLRSGNIAPACAAEFIAGVPGELRRKAAEGRRQRTGFGT
ncbi:MAG: glycosyltransferase [Arthrobacter sp.]